MKKACVLSYPLSTSEDSDQTGRAAQADLSLRWAHSHFVGFVLGRLNYYFMSKMSLCFVEIYRTPINSNERFSRFCQCWLHKQCDAALLLGCHYFLIMSISNLIKVTMILKNARSAFKIIERAKPLNLGRTTWLQQVCLLQQDKWKVYFHDLSRLMTKATKWRVRPAKTQISLGVRPVWSESSLCAQWVAKDLSFLHADSEDSD